MTDTPTPPMTPEQRAHFCRLLNNAGFGECADQLEADGVTIATITAERDAAQAEIARLTDALATAREDGMREAAMCFDAIAHATPAQSPKHMAANYRDRFLDIIAKGAAT